MGEQHHSAAVAADHRRLRKFAAGVVAALHPHVRAQPVKHRGGHRLVEGEDGVKAFQRGQHPGPVRCSYQRQARPLQRPHRGIGVQAHYQAVAQPAALPQQPDVHGVQPVDAAAVSLDGFGTGEDLHIVVVPIVHGHIGRAADCVPSLCGLGRGAGDLRVGVAHLGQGIKLAGTSRWLCRVGAEQRERVLDAQLIPQHLELDGGIDQAGIPEQRHHLAEDANRLPSLGRLPEQGADRLPETSGRDGCAGFVSQIAG